MVRSCACVCVHHLVYVMSTLQLELQRAEGGAAVVAFQSTGGQQVEYESTDCIDTVYLIELYLKRHDTL